MKTQVLHLESYDDRHSILDKLNWGQADRVIMVWPVRGIPLDNKLDLKLIHRRCQSAEVSLALVCKKRAVIDFASDLGIPVFRSLRQAQRIPWEYSLPPSRKAQKPEKTRTREELTQLIERSSAPAWTQSNPVRILAAVFSLLAVLAMAGFLLPGARIEYLPPLETQSLPLTLSASPEYQTYNLSGAIPAHFLTVTVEGRRETESSGQTGIADKPAQGMIVLTNLTDQEITIPAGTLIRTTDASSIYRFRTLSETILPPESGATVTIPIECTNPGPEGNLPANSLVVLESDLSRSLTANNPEPTTGGSEQFSRSPIPEDYQELSEVLMASLWQTALEEAQVTLDEGDVILDSEPSVAIVLEESFSPPEPQPSSTLSLLLRVEYEIMYLSGSELQAMGNAILDATLPAGYNAQPETFNISSISSPEAGDSQEIAWPVELSRQIFTIKSLANSIDKILGQPPERAASLLQSELDLSSKPQISIFPEWWPVMPLLQVRIEAVDLIQER